jgi:hypothetical protein
MSNSVKYLLPAMSERLLLMSGEWGRQELTSLNLNP